MASMFPKPEIKACIICDLARKEQGGRDILIGVYAGKLFSPTMPCSLVSFAVWVQLKPLRERFDNMAVEVLQPNGEVLLSGKGTITFNPTDMHHFVGLPFQFPATRFPVPGVYRIVLEIDGERFDIDEFEVVHTSRP